jgi:hypothetical protein
VAADSFRGHPILMECWTPAYLPSFAFVDDLWQNGYVSIRGTWQILNDQIAYPDQTTRVECQRDPMTCSETKASLGRSTGSPMLFMDATFYDVERWDEFEIVTT